jgi:3-oxoacyl-[acyl-carrier protein] reductase
MVTAVSVKSTAPHLVFKSILAHASDVVATARSDHLVRLRAGSDYSAERRRDMGLLEGDTALVTGAASGIGRGIAKALAAEGVRLVLSDIAEQAGAALSRELNTAFIAADLADPPAARRLFEAAVKTLGSISILVHSASPRRYESESVLAVTEAQWDSMIAVGLRAGFVLGQAVGAHMKARQIRGRMLFITSLHAYTPRNLPHYSATKAGQTMLVKELARALGADGIRVNAIAPGAIPGGGFDADVSSLTKMIPLGRTGTPEDVAGMAVALLCDRFSRYVTGTTVAVDGGLALFNWIPIRAGQ